MRRGFHFGTRDVVSVGVKSVSIVALLALLLTSAPLASAYPAPAGGPNLAPAGYEPASRPVAAQTPTPPTATPTPSTPSQRPGPTATPTPPAGGSHASPAANHPVTGTQPFANSHVQPPHSTASKPATSAASTPFAIGDVLVGIGNGQIEHFTSNGTLVNVLDTGTGAAYNTGMCFDPSYTLYATDFGAQAVSTFNSAGDRLQSYWGSGYNLDPESCVADSTGHIYVGQADGTGQILKFDLSGNLVASYAPTTEDRGTDWIDLAADQCTVYYSSEGYAVHRFNVCTNTQLPDFATGLNGPCYALRIRANGEVMVACEAEVYRLDATGNVIQTYLGSAYGEYSFFAANLDPDGTSFWTAGLTSGVVYKIDIATGALLTSFNANPNVAVAGIIVYGETTQGATSAKGPTGSERNGDRNPSELNACRPCVGDPIDIYSGNFTHTFTDVSVPGRGIPLDFTRTYNAQAAAQNGPLGYGWTSSYNAALAVDGTTGNVTITQENGSTVAFSPNGSGGFTAPARVLATLATNPDGSYAYTRIQDQMHFTFSASGQLLSETDRNGYTTHFGYTGSQLTSVTDAAGRTLAMAYDGSGRLSSVTDPLSRQVTFTYDASGNLATATDVGGGVWHFTYDTNHLLLTMTDPRGGVTTNVYDASGRVTSQTDPMSRTTTFAYATLDSNGDTTTTITDPRGIVTVEDFHNGLLLSKTLASGTSQSATWSYSYDPSTLGQTSIADPNGHVTTKTWDANGNVLTSTDALGHTTSFTYDTLNDVTSMTDPLGVTTTYTYDAHGNRLSASTPLVGTGQTQTTTYTYGDAAHPGDVTAMTDADGNTWTYAYDANCNQVRVTDPLGDTTTASFNALGWKTRATGANSNTAALSVAGTQTTYAYNAFGDVTQVTDPLGHTTSTQYDAAGNVTQVTDANGHVTQNTYNADDELTQVTRADGTTLTYAYDGDGNQTQQTDGRGKTTTYGFDALNHLAAVTDPLTRTTHFTYDGAGNRLTLVDAAGQTTSYAYDPANQLINITYSDGTTPPVSYGYDADGQRTYLIDGTGFTSSTYDSLHRLTFVSDGASHAVSYGYDLAGHQTSLAAPNGQTVTRIYDRAGRLVAVKDWLGHTTTFTYDPDGNLGAIAYPNGLSAQMTYDAADRLTQISDVPTHPVQPKSGSGVLSPPTPLPSFSYARDDDGLLSGVRPQAVPQTDEAYSYSALNQVTGVSAPSGPNASTYTYDAAGNLTQRGAATLSYDAANQLTSLAQNGQTTSYTFDARGNRTQQQSGGSGSTTYGYDQANRLTGYTHGSTTATYAYNGDGLRMSSTVNGTSTSFVWDLSQPVPLLLQKGATAFVYGPGGLPIEQIASNGTPLYFLQDALGSTRALANAAGSVVATFAYDAYGNLTGQTGSASTPLLFAGQYRDAESGLYYLRARSYDPSTGQFLTRDPLETLTKLAYAYAGGNPVNFSDPSGQFVWALVTGAIGAVVGAGSDVLLQEATHPGSVDWWEVGAHALGGFVGGAVGGLCGPLCTIAGGAAGAAVSDSLTQTEQIVRHQKSGFDVGEFALGVGMGTSVGWLTDNIGGISDLEGNAIGNAANESIKSIESTFLDPTAYTDLINERAAPAIVDAFHLGGTQSGNYCSVYGPTY